MSLVNRTANSLGRPPALCPYCDHVSPLDSKFCNECGAALNLLPCPHCGSINDVMLTSQCARCNTPLPTGAFALPGLPAAPREPELPAVLMNESIDRASVENQAALPRPNFDASSARLLPPLGQRPRAVLVGGLLLIAAAAAAAAAAYLLVQQRDTAGMAKLRAVAVVAAPDAGATARPDPATVLPPSPTLPYLPPSPQRAASVSLPVTQSGAMASVATEVPATAASSVANVPAAKPVPAPAPAPVVALKSLPEAAVPPALAAAANRPSAAGRATAFKGGSANLNRTWASAADAAELAHAAEALQLQLRSRARLDAVAGMDLPAPNLGPCTQAVAALGLCAAPEKQPTPP